MEIYCSLNMYEANDNPQTLLSDTTMLTICFYMTERYQLKIQPSQGVEIIVEDIISPELCAYVKIPLFVTPLNSLRQKYVSRELSKLNLDPTVREYLKEQIESRVLGEVERNGMFKEGFQVVAELQVFKVESVYKEEFDRHASQIHGSDGADLLHWDIPS
ncbi:hypothetical protein FCV25MIE_30415 [Fagus crenata]